MKTPAYILAKFERAAVGLEYGSVSLSLFIKNGELRYVILREESFIYKGEELISCHTDGTEQLLNTKRKRKLATVIDPKPKTYTS
jgi:hypothetical protein